MLARQVFVSLIRRLRINAGLIIMGHRAEVYQTKVNKLKLEMLCDYQV